MILSKVREIIAGILDIDENDISEHALLEEDLGTDELSKYEIILAAEETFDIEISPDLADDIMSVRDLVEVIRSAEE